MNPKNMRRLIAHLRKVPRRGFRMYYWVTDKYGIRLTGGLSELRRASRNGYKCGMAACVGGHLAMIFGKPELESFTVFTQQTLGLCSMHTNLLTSAHAPHQTPKAAARFLQRLLDSRPECCR